MSDSSGVPRYPCRDMSQPHSTREASGLAEREPAAYLIHALAADQHWQDQVAGYLAAPAVALRDHIARMYAPARKASRGRRLFAQLLDHCLEVHREVEPAPPGGPDRWWLVQSMSTLPAFFTWDAREPRPGDVQRWPGDQSVDVWRRGIALILARGAGLPTGDDPRDRHWISAVFCAVTELDDDGANVARRRRIKHAA